MSRSTNHQAVGGMRLKAAVSVSEMARSLRLSRARFYELIEAGIMPPPLYLLRTKRPFYNAELQAVCLRVRETGEGLNGEPVVFYAARTSVTPRKTRDGSKVIKKTKRAVSSEIRSILDGLKQLGITDADAGKVEAVVAELYPSGVGTEASGTVLTAVFRELKRRN